jgi:hypothetical protein
MIRRVYGCRFWLHSQMETARHGRNRKTCIFWVTTSSEPPAPKPARSARRQVGRGSDWTNRRDLSSNIEGSGCA